jgi:aspartate-semialdehyde dehydrogenase
MPQTSPSIALVGATGAVGRECLSILEQRSFPVKSLRLLASARSAGSTIPFKGKPIAIEELGPRSFEGIDLAFFAVGSDTAKAFAPIAVAAGATVIDKSSAHRDDPSCPLIIPEINADSMFSSPLRASVPSCLRASAPIIAVPNCSTIILLLPLEPLRRAFSIDRIVVSTYQAASGAGAAAMAELEEQTRTVQAGGRAEPRIFKEPCAFNVFSHDSKVDPETGSNGEEAKMASETRRIWADPAIRVSATCVRVGVLRGHSESINLTLKTPATEAQVRQALASGPALRIVDGRAASDFPTPLKATGGDEVLVGRIRPDPSQGESGGGRYIGWNLFVSGDQLRLGAALTAVKIAERLLQ